MENLEANVLSLDVTHLAISLETCNFQKDPAYQSKFKHSIPPNFELLILLKYSSSLTLFTLKKLKQKIILTKQTTSDLSSKESIYQKKPGSPA
ncbi:hypothetical protein PSHT_10178 [Puccinia striiformis]|uniref:Uncharacterized protein n=1 Tax=Puccinia striiformis TaxID=27350 RepID=A0A2S4VBL1_9BASI|nr:hypothetical protein PSHT_10178 [Puccinia striiformis]